MADSNGEKPVSRQELTEALNAQKVEFLSAVKELVQDTGTKLLNAFFPYQAPK